MLMYKSFTFPVNIAGWRKRKDRRPPVVYIRKDYETDNIMKKILLIMATVLSTASVFGQKCFDLPLYPGGPRDSNGITAPEINDGGFIMNVTQPMLSVYLPMPEKATGQAVIAFPGGGYAGVVWTPDGTGFTEWFNEQGIALIMLKYRMPNGHPEIPLRDALASIELVRSNAEKWGMDEGNVGLIGFSAGGHLAALASTLFTGTENRPDFAVLIYPLISLSEELSHFSIRDIFLGEGYTAADTERYSAEKQVGRDTPPMFIAATARDGMVDPRSSTAMFDALQAVDIPSSLHIYPFGEHGWEFTTPGTSFKYAQELKLSLSNWLKDYK